MSMKKLGSLLSHAVRSLLGKCNSLPSDRNNNASDILYDLTEYKKQSLEISTLKGRHKYRF